jgi:hypothetical protein
MTSHGKNISLELSSADWGGQFAAPPENHSFRQEKTISVKWEREDKFDDFYHHLSRHKERSKTTDGDLFSFDLGERKVKLQLQVKHAATGFSEHNQVFIYLTNKSDDGDVVDLTFDLQLKTQFGFWWRKATRESPFSLPFGKKFPMFSFPAASCLTHCDPSRSLHVKTRMEFFYYITLTKKPSESPDHLEELPSASDSGG